MPRRKTAGQRLIADMSEDGDPYSLTVLIVEAGRVADRLERLDGILSGEQTSWARLVIRRGASESVLEINIDNGLAEARQQATVLRQLIVEIQRRRAQNPSETPDDDLAGL